MKTIENQQVLFLVNAFASCVAVAAIGDLARDLCFKVDDDMRQHLNGTGLIVAQHAQPGLYVWSGSITVENEDLREFDSNIKWDGTVRRAVLDDLTEFGLASQLIEAEDWQVNAETELLRAARSFSESVHRSLDQDDLFRRASNYQRALAWAVASLDNNQVYNLISGIEASNNSQLWECGFCHAKVVVYEDMEPVHLFEGTWKESLDTVLEMTTGARASRPKMLHSFSCLYQQARIAASDNYLNINPFEHSFRFNMFGFPSPSNAYKTELNIEHGAIKLDLPVSVTPDLTICDREGPHLVTECGWMQMAERWSISSQMRFNFKSIFEGIALVAKGENEPGNRSS